VVKNKNVKIDENDVSGNQNKCYWPLKLYINSYLKWQSGMENSETKATWDSKQRTNTNSRKKRLATQISSNITGMLVCGLTRVVCIVVGYLTTISV
jgi:hypothetical protein